VDYCARCVYPANARPGIIFDDDGVCSGCRYHESRQRIDWGEREQMLAKLLDHYKGEARARGQAYDCIIPVSGGKDSHFQVHLIKNVYGLNPLLVTFNHCFNTELGVRNLANLVSEFDCDLVRFTPGLGSVQKISRHMLKTVGDLTWHYHAGIRTLPFRVAVQQDIPLVIWGEHGFAELTGMFTLEDMVEFTKWSRQEHDMRGVEAHSLISEETGITAKDIQPYVYPSDEEIEGVGIRGIYLSNFLYWDAKQQAELVIDKYNFGIYSGGRERTFVRYAKTDDHANDVHDYLKYLKFGYGRATDDASTEVRHGRMTREEAIDLVAQYDHRRPGTLDTYLSFLKVSEQEFMDWVAPMRDRELWNLTDSGEWVATDSVANHRSDASVDAARVPLVAAEERTFAQKNAHLYHSEASKEHQTPWRPKLEFLVL
jgi:N-acetyl sugar amidotransferase